MYQIALGRTVGLDRAGFAQAGSSPVKSTRYALQGLGCDGCASKGVNALGCQSCTGRRSPAAGMGALGFDLTTITDQFTAAPLQTGAVLVMGGYMIWKALFSRESRSARKQERYSRAAKKASTAYQSQLAWAKAKYA